MLEQTHDEAAKQQAIKDLLEIGKEKGHLSMDEVGVIIDEFELESDEQDKLLDLIEKAGISIAINEGDILLDKIPGEDLDDVVFPEGEEITPEDVSDSIFFTFRTP